MKALLAGVALALGLLLFLQWKDWPPEPPRAGSDASGPTGVAPADTSPQPKLVPQEAKEAYAPVNDRTLFRPQRKPPEPESAQPDSGPESAEAGNLDNADLSAVVIAPGMRMAWVVDQTQELKRLRQGDSYEGWTVKDITPDTLVLERQGQTNTLILRDFSKAPPPAAPVPVQPRQTPAAQRGPQPPQGAKPSLANRPVAPPRPVPVAPRAAPNASPQARPNAPRVPPQRPE